MGLVGRVARIAAWEVLEIGVDWVFAPSASVARDYRQDRTYERYASDTSMVAAYAAEFVRAVQSDHQGESLIACAKHRVGDGGTHGIDQGEVTLDFAALERLHIAAGLFDKPRLQERFWANHSQLGSAAHRSVACEAVRKLLVSLKLAKLHPEDLRTIETISAKGIPVVAILVSGRPLVVGRELQASGAFVAAWLPGAEGGGVSDVLFGDFDFAGTLSFAWPERDPASFPRTFRQRHCSSGGTD